MKTKGVKGFLYALKKRHLFIRLALILASVQRLIGTKQATGHVFYKGDLLDVSSEEEFGVKSGR